MVDLVSAPVVVTPGGDILAHARSAAIVDLSFENEDGSARDVSASVLYFEIDQVARLVVGSGSPSNKRTLTIPQATVAQIPQTGARFALRDETGTPIVIWAGRISSTGFSASPT